VQLLRCLSLVPHEALGPVVFLPRHIRHFPSGHGRGDAHGNRVAHHAIHYHCVLYCHHLRLRARCCAAIRLASMRVLPCLQRHVSLAHVLVTMRVPQHILVYRQARSLPYIALDNTPLPLPPSLSLSAHRQACRTPPTPRQAAETITGTSASGQQDVPEAQQ
jgi:hypothetical protein